MLLQYPEQADLEGRAGISDFIEKYSTAFGQGKLSGFVFDRMGKGPFFIAE